MHAAQSIYQNAEPPLTVTFKGSRFLENTWKLPVVDQDSVYENRSNSLVQPLEMPDVIPAQLILDMQRAAYNGFLDENGCIVFKTAWTAHGIAGIAHMRDNLNLYLESNGSCYSARTAKIDNSSQQVDLYVVLLQPWESLDVIVLDLKRNGANSEYASRAFVLKVDVR